MLGVSAALRPHRCDCCDPLPVEAIVDAVDGVHRLRLQRDELVLVLLHRRLLVVCQSEWNAQPITNGKLGALNDEIMRASSGETLPCA